jgi:prepilin-type N-terminal cleavage/methylation domain-containing protein
MRTRREGFTLIELLIVIVIIGILAAIAIPKFGATREKAYFKAMMSDLRNLSAQQEIFYSNNPDYEYAGDVVDLEPLGFEASAGVTVTITGSGTDGWSATATHQAILDGRSCAVFHGDVAYQQDPATVAGVIACDELVAP